MSFKNTPISNSNKSKSRALVDALREAAQNKVDIGAVMNEVFTKEHPSYPSENTAPHKKLANAMRDAVNYGVDVTKAVKHAEKLDTAVAYQRTNSEYLQQAKEVAMGGVSLLSAIGVSTKREKKANDELAALKKSCQMKLNKAVVKIGKSYSLDSFEGKTTTKDNVADQPVEPLTAAALRKQYRGY